MSLRTRVLPTVACLWAIAAGPASAAVITTFFGTGVGASGALLANGAIDPHYTVSPGTAFTIDNATRPGSWVANTATSQWISTGRDTLGGPGPFTYTTTFDLTGFDAATAAISFDVAADNQATIFLDGVQVGVRAFGGWTSFQTFTLTSGFQAGINTLSFVVPNNQETPNDGPTGLQVRVISATANTVPEPSTAALGALALLAVWRTGRRARPAG